MRLWSKTGRTPAFPVAMAGLLVVVSLYGLASSALSISSQSPVDMTPTAENYLPYVANRPRSTATPTATAEPVGDWLSYLNSYRAQAQLPPVTENADWSYGDRLHARYMVKNDTIGHDEDPNNPWYTPEGDAAAEASNVMVSSRSTTPDEVAIDLWMQGPFHAVGIVDPALGRVGFGSYRETVGTWQMGAALDVLRGLGAIPAAVSFPIVWPGNGTTSSLGSYGGSESPDPLTGCPGYEAPSGLPLLLQIGPGNITPDVTGHSLRTDGAELAHCIFDETTYSNPDGGLQNLGRAVLDSRDAIVLIPRDPLAAGQAYSVSITANGQNYAWTFDVSATWQPSTEELQAEFEIR